ncbi:serine/threonine protein kinase [Nodularia sphaerocarpa]|uniref:serine/threonine protein kinase n=1 Tax=Nodularia sphaerocarpa TaxID=137816 RepID=UPI001EFBF583|nr:serine/threonine protein kinase [Nodularia sphaerocarpa]MDB9371948.1 serine/threonine protein kinase [Nodularia sphaerocarpa CS-585]ULP70769.1 HPr kinase/phosphorylase [Nodularia sphaerocarpa UHCC 0038]
MMQLSKSFRYKVYGLTLQTNQPLPGLIPAETDAPVDVWVDLNGESQPSSAEIETISSGLNVVSQADGTYFHLWFRGEGQLNFYLDAGGSHISANWTCALLEEVSALLLGQVLGCVLRLRGTLCLHACVVKIGQHAVAIVGESGAGKSTTAAALAKEGYSILSDDIAVLKDDEQNWFVQPGYPRIRLWPQTINALYGSESDFTKIFISSEKRFVELVGDSSDTVCKFYSDPLPLAAIYVLGKRQPELVAPMIETISPATAVMTLMTHRSVSHLKLGMDEQAGEFAGLSRLAMSVPIRKVSRSDSLTALPQLCDAIVNDVGNITLLESV